MIPQRSNGGFSLVEIVLAMGVFSIAIVAIIGLFPTALNSAQRARAETSAAMVARAIMADLRAHPFDQARLQNGGSVGNPTYSNAFSLATAGTQFMRYDFGSDGNRLQPRGPANQSQYDNGGPNLGLMIAAIKITPDPINRSLSQVEVSVEYPTAAKRENRTAARFVTLICK